MARHDFSRSMDAAFERLAGRGTEPADVIERRLQVAMVELAAVAEFDETIVNDDVEAVCERLVALMGVSS